MKISTNPISTEASVLKIPQDCCAMQNKEKEVLSVLSLILQVQLLLLDNRQEEPEEENNNPCQFMWPLMDPSINTS